MSSIPQSCSIKLSLLHCLWSLFLCIKNSLVQQNGKKKGYEKWATSVERWKEKTQAEYSVCICTQTISCLWPSEGFPLSSTVAILKMPSIQIEINCSRDPLSGSIAAGVIWIKKLILIQLLLLFTHTSAYAVHCLFCFAGCSANQCSYFVKDLIRFCTHLRQVEWCCIQYYSLLAPFYFIFRLSGCTYTAKL